MKKIKEVTRHLVNTLIWDSVRDPINKVTKDTIQYTGGVYVWRHISPFLDHTVSLHSYELVNEVVDLPRIGEIENN